jgi:ribonuclease HI
MTTGEVITLANIEKYDEAIPAVVKMTNIPKDWAVTIIENKPTAIMVACAPPSYGPITTEKYNELQRRTASELSVIPKPRAVPKAVMLVVTYVHLTPKRKEHVKTFNFRMEEGDDKQMVLDRWIALAKIEAGLWDAIGRKMSVRAKDYNWYTGTKDPLQFPWYDCEAISFHGPPRSSTDIRPPDSNDPEPGDSVFGSDANGPSFGPGADGSMGPQGPGSAGASSRNASGVGGGKRGPTDAPEYTTSTVHVTKGAAVDVLFLCLDREVRTSVASDVKESMIQRIVANMTQKNLNGYWVAKVVDGFGRVGALCNGATVRLTPATPAQIQNVIQARTTSNDSSYHPDKPRKPKTHEQRKAKSATTSTNWLGIQANREKEVDWLEFRQRVERDKMVHVVTDGRARPNPGSGGWGVLMRQSGHYAINWGHWDMTTNNAMELLAVTEALANLPDGMHVWVMTDSAYVKNGIMQWVSTWIRNGWKNSGGARVANKSLWERLIAGVNRMKRVEWSWVKAHNGRLLNECADTLATRGVLG